MPSKRRLLEIGSYYFMIPASMNYRKLKSQLSNNSCSVKFRKLKSNITKRCQAGDLDAIASLTKPKTKHEIGSYKGEASSCFLTPQSLSGEIEIKLDLSSPEHDFSWFSNFDCRSQLLLMYILIKKYSYFANTLIDEESQVGDEQINLCSQLLSSLPKDEILVTLNTVLNNSLTDKMRDIANRLIVDIIINLTQKDNIYLYLILSSILRISRQFNLHLSYTKDSATGAMFQLLLFEIYLECEETNYAVMVMEDIVFEALDSEQLNDFGDLLTRLCKLLHSKMEFKHARRLCRTCDKWANIPPGLSDWGILLLQMLVTADHVKERYISVWYQKLVSKGVTPPEILQRTCAVLLLKDKSSKHEGEALFASAPVYKRWLPALKPGPIANIIKLQISDQCTALEFRLVIKEVKNFFGKRNKPLSDNNVFITLYKEDEINDIALKIRALNEGTNPYDRLLVAAKKESVRCTELNTAPPSYLLSFV